MTALREWLAACWPAAVAYLAAVNVTAFCLMGADKRRAQRAAWRIPEKVLFAVALLGGAAGGILGMRAFRHKTRKWYFALGFPLLLAAQAIGLVLLLR